MWEIKATVVLVVTRTTPKLGKWLRQIPGITSEISVQRSAILKRDSEQNPQVPQLLADLSFKGKNKDHPHGRVGI